MRPQRGRVYCASLGGETEAATALTVNIQHYCDMITEVLLPQFEDFAYENTWFQ